MPADVAGTATPESALSAVQEILTQLIGTLDEQFAALAGDDIARLGHLVQQQEVLSTRLAQAEQRRLSILPSGILGRDGRGEDDRLRDMGQIIEELRERSARNRALLERKARLSSQSLQYLKAIVVENARLYGAQSVPPTAPVRSLLLDSSA